MTLEHTEESITLAGLNASSANLIQPGTPIVCQRMAIGRVAVPSQPTAINQDLRALELKEDVDPQFIAWYLQYSGSQLAALATGTTVKGLRIADLERHHVPVVDLPEQRRIAHVLDTADAAIRRTEAVIDKLEQVKQGLLHDLLTRGLDEEGRLRPPPEEAPGQFIETPIGPVPTEWRTGQLGELLMEIEAGKSPRCPNRPATTGQWGVLKVGAVHPDGFQPEENKVITDPSKIHPEYEVAHGDVLVSRANTSELVGMPCYVENPPPHLMLSDKTLRLHPNDSEVEPRLLPHLLMMASTRRQVEVEATGTSGSMKNISQKGLKRLEVPIIPEQEQLRIIRTSERLSHRLELERRQATKIRRLKSGLMQDLLTGRVRVPESVNGGQATA